jgi:alpha-beta hydrolase superfamily lysophospholipase
MKRTVTIGALFLISFLALGAAVVCAQAPAQSKVETGSIGDAVFRIEIPPNWNNGLVMFAHGYTQPDYSQAPPAFQLYRDIFLSRGFAFADSAYSAHAYTVKTPAGFLEGYAVKEGVEDTEALRRHFVSRYGKPQRTYIVGDSMGALITIATMER